MRKILFLCTEGFDTPGPSNHLICSLIEDLLEANFKISLIQSRRNKLKDDLPKELKNKVNFISYSINRKKIPKQFFVRRYLEEAIYAFRCFKVWRRMKDIDAVFVQSCPTAVFSIILIRLFLKKPILYSIQDVWPGSAVNSGVLSVKWIAKMFYFIQKAAYKMSDVLTVISEDMKQKLVEQNVPAEKIVKIVNWFNDRAVHEVDWENNQFVKKYKIEKDKFYVQYAGTMGYVFDFKMVLDVAERLKKYNDIVFHMIGNGSQKADFMKETEMRNLNNIVFYPLQSQNLVSHVYSSCSICLIPLKKGIIGNSVPSKAGLLMACNRVIVNSVDEDSDWYRMFHEREIGIAVSNDYPNGVARAILDLYKNKDKRERLAKRGYNFGQKYFSRSLNTKKFIGLFEMIIEERE